MGYEPRAMLERQRTQANAAAEAEESARRQDRQDGNKKGGIFGDDITMRGEGNWLSKMLSGGKESKGNGRGRGKERRSVYVNLEGAPTDPKGYERNKVRTSKYTLLTFVPKVSNFEFFFFRAV